MQAVQFLWCVIFIMDVCGCIATYLCYANGERGLACGLLVYIICFTSVLCAGCYNMPFYSRLVYWYAMRYPPPVVSLQDLRKQIGDLEPASVQFDNEGGFHSADEVLLYDDSAIMTD